MVDKDVKEKFKKIYEVLPKLDDRRCGYRTCGEFALAVAKGEAPCYGCVTGGYRVAEKVCEIMGKKVPRREEIPTTGINNTEPRGFRTGRGMGRGMDRARGRGYVNHYNRPPGSKFRYKTYEPDDFSTECKNYYFNKIHDMSSQQNMSPGQEKRMLEKQANLIKMHLDEIKSRITELEKKE